ncbi:MAG TPA: hypothetical protein VFL83_17970 [Anaeromyxobacter sp.]|nr:hypothetical protein [Anaeromyxobacter sp.]
MKLRGSRPGIVSSFTVRLGPLRASAGTVGVSDAGLRSADLVAADSVLLGTITLAGGGPVSVSFDVTSAHVTGTGLSGEIAACAPVKLSFTPAQVRSGTCHVVVDLDLGRSVQRDPVTGAAFILPHHTVRF